MKKEEEKQIRIQDDLYQYVNGKWISEAVIPNDLPLTGGFTSISQEVEKTLMADFKKFADNEKECDIKIISDAVKLYKKILDADARNKEGISPALPLLDKIKNLKDLKEFNDLSYDLLNDFVSFPFEMDIVEDVTDTSKQAFMIFDPQTILPDKGLYDKKLVKFFMMKMYKKMIKDLLKFTPLSKKEQKEFLKDTIIFDDLLRRKVKSQTENADYVKLFNPMKLDEVNNYMQPFDLKGLLSKMYQDKTPELINVGNPAFVKEFKDILNDNTFKYFIHWVYVNTLCNYAPALSKEISDTARYYMNKLTGVKENPVIEKQAYRLVSRIYSEPIGIYYGRNYFGEEAKKDITDLTYNIIDTYKERVKNNEILEEATKEKAILKLSTIKVKMGYPDNYDPFYDTLTVSEDDSYFDAMKKIMKLQMKHQFDKLLKPTDFSKWAMPGHMVNACYDPFKNDITFPAAILQKPFYNVNQALEENLGGIGAVIGHEISHAFDNNGSHFDERGVLNDWWKEEDFKRFEEKTKAMIAQYDGIIYHGGKVNGKLVVSENIADNGGVAVTLQIMKGLDNPKYDLYFMNWARIWCQKAKDSYIKLLLTNDVHSPAELRANMTPRNFSEWYETFNVKDTDKMFIPEDKRIVIW